MTVEEVDACTGPAVGWPKSATFRTADIVGLDVLVHVVKNIYETRRMMNRAKGTKWPALVEEMVKRGWLGDKTGQGFYKKVKGEGEKEILTLDINTMEYRPRQKARFASLEMGKAIEDTRERLRALIGPVLEGQKGTRRSSFCGGGLSETVSTRRGACRNFRPYRGRRSRHALGIWLGIGAVRIMDAIGVKAFAGASAEGRAHAAARD